MRWAGTAAGCVAAGAAVCLALGDAMPLPGVLLWWLVTAGEHTKTLCTDLNKLVADGVPTLTSQHEHRNRDDELTCVPGALQ